MNERKEILEKFSRMLDIMDDLRAKCPWNGSQTMDSLRTLTIEEVYELSEAVIRKEDKDIRKELGDVLLHVIFYSKIAQEQGKYDIGDVLDSLSEKMIYRHPHVFSQNPEQGGQGRGANLDAKQVSENWEMLKVKERGGNKTILSGIPKALPSLVKGFAMIDKAAGVGFPVETADELAESIAEKMAKLQARVSRLESGKGGKNSHTLLGRAENTGENGKEAAEQIGGVLFDILKLSRYVGVDPDTALNLKCQEFAENFTRLETETIRKGRDLKDVPLKELEAIFKGKK